MATDAPRIISVDDHVVEPPDLWTSRLPAALREQGPRVVREKGAWDGVTTDEWNPNVRVWLDDPEAPGADWVDVWRYEDMVTPLQRGPANAGYGTEDPYTAITYDDVLPGTYQRQARLADMDLNRTDVSLCFPTVSRFCGQMFLERQDKDLALLGVQAYNDWTIEEWCGGLAEPVRLVPVTLVPLWDPELAAAEVRRCAEKGSHAITFSECPPYLGLPSVFSGHWDPLFAACDETDTVVNMHIGSSSTLVRTADDAPTDMTLCIQYVNTLLALNDWLYSGTLQLFPNLRIALSEGQAGWIPFAADRIDSTWRKGNAKYEHGAGRRAAELPSSVLDRVYACIVDDLTGLELRHRVGVDQLLFETDYPHTDSLWPDSWKVADELFRRVGLTDDEVYKVVRGNAIKAYRLDTYFGIKS
ncbi:MAG: amidohydrolase family protein [Acidimicrobiia bacterium]